MDFTSRQADRDPLQGPKRRKAAHLRRLLVDGGGDGLPARAIDVMFQNAHFVICRAAERSPAFRGNADMRIRAPGTAAFRSNIIRIG